MKKLALVTGALHLAACSFLTDAFETNEFSGDEFPIYVEMQSGAIALGVRQDGVSDRSAILDVLSPLTIVDSGPDSMPEITSKTLTLLGQNGPGGPIEHPRARFDNAPLMTLHPCENLVETCVVGPIATPREFQSIVGADALAGDAVRLRLGDGQIFVLPDIGGDQIHRTRACDGVFPSPYRGGGTLLVDGTEHPFTGRRISLGACLGPNPSPAVPQSQRGSDALLVVSTSVGITILGQPAYERYREAYPTAPPFETLPEDAINLPSGPIDGRRGTILSLALVASGSVSRAPCRQVYASHFIATRNCVPEDDCPCEDEVFCGVPAILELAPPGGLDVLIVPNANATLQSLRTELRPDQPEVDGIVGTTALLAAEIDVDYPHNRILTRCRGAGCVTRPEINDTDQRTQARGCLEYAPPGPEFPLP